MDFAREAAARATYRLVPDEAVQVNVSGTQLNNTGGNYDQIQLVVDGTAVGTNSVQSAQENTAGFYMPVGLSRSSDLSENAHSAAVALSVNGGSGTFTLNHTAAVRQ